MLGSDRYEAAPGLWLDARRAIWFPQEQILAVADLHLGYAWAQRHAGQLLPVSAPDDTVTRLLALQREYQPRQFVLLGDIVHRAVDLRAIQVALQGLTALTAVCQVRFVAGNHDRDLAKMLPELGFDQEVNTHVKAGPHILLHGDGSNPELETRLPHGGWVVIGHEHPVIRLGDGVTGSVKCPCFLVGAGMLILPAFSTWAAGSSVRPTTFMSGLARAQTFRQAVAIVGHRLLPMPWP